MLDLDRELFDEFKRVDAICRDMFSSQRGVGEYINQMEQILPRARYGIPSWDNDYRMLKRICWLRNQIAHEVTVADCTVKDVEYLRDFHDRLLRQQDPLAALRKVEQEKRRPLYQQTAPQKVALYRDDHYGQRPSSKGRGFLWGIATVIIFIAVVVLCFLK